MVELYWPTLNLVNEINEYMSSSNPTEGITYLSFNVGLFFIFEKKKHIFVSLYVVLSRVSNSKGFKL